MAVRFLGPRRDVPALLGAADVVVVPSTWEGQPLIVQEALRAGRPLVATRVGGIADLTGEDGAVLVPPGDPVALAAAVTRILDDPEAAARLAAAARGPGGPAAHRDGRGGPGAWRLPGDDHEAVNRTSVTVCGDIQTLPGTDIYAL